MPSSSWLDRPRWTRAARSSPTRPEPAGAATDPTSRSPRRSSTADPAGPGIAVVVFGLGSAIAWGAGDFSGGWAGRRAPVLSVAIVVDLIGALVMTAVALAIGEPFP